MVTDDDEGASSVEFQPGQKAQVLSGAGHVQGDFGCLKAAASLSQACQSMVLSHLQALHVGGLRFA